MMTDCRRTVDRLAAYADRELPAAEQAEVEQHIVRCPPCRAAATAERGGRTILRERAETLRCETLPPGLRSRCEALARLHARKGTPLRRWSAGLVPALLTAALVLVTVLVLFSLSTHRSNTLLAAQLTVDHAKCFRLFAGPGSAEADAARVEQMLEDSYGWDVHVPPSSSAAGVQLIGARRCLYADGAIPHVMYRVNGADVSLYVLDGVTRSDADVTTLGHASRVWSRGDTTYVLVAPAGAANLAAGLRYVMDETQ